MKRILVCLLILLGFVLVSCEEEHERHGGFRERGFRDGGYQGRECRLMNQTTENDGILQVESTVEP